MSQIILFGTRTRTPQSSELEPRYTRRLSDKITAAFYDACAIGNLDTARQLMVALECEVARSVRLLKTDGRDDGDDTAAVRARFAIELNRQAQASSGQASQASASEASDRRLPDQAGSKQG